REWVRLTGEDGQCGGNLFEAGAHIDRSHSCFAAGMTRVGLRDGIAEVALDPFQRRVAQPVCRDPLGGHPWQQLADPNPQVVVAAVRDRPAVAVSKELTIPGSVPLFGVLQ